MVVRQQAVTLLRALIKDAHHTALPSLRRAFSLSSLNVSERQIRRIFTKWSKDYGKIYLSAEEREDSYEAFKKNYLFIRDPNNAQEAFSLNYCSDLTDQEFADMFLTRWSRYRVCTCSRPAMAANSDVPDSRRKQVGPVVARKSASKAPNKKSV